MRAITWVIKMVRVCFEWWLEEKDGSERFLLNEIAFVARVPSLNEYVHSIEVSSGIRNIGIVTKVDLFCYSQVEDVGTPLATVKVITGVDFS
ncbi:hypothetical protein FD724_07570 [Nostoc sp. C057]|uniref:hypothetical protein n=1 Tax=Nostoc sp. C057 TaxID=2576903 RepID=UPI0015C3FE6D|nr:hypothetical protein [Nostoc sp. C057]QLE47994.1 hypothetical protein FD724_07570 [Nostoc sp. C057]